MSVLKSGLAVLGDFYRDMCIPVKRPALTPMTRSAYVTRRQTLVLATSYTPVPDIETRQACRQIKNLASTWKNLLLGENRDLLEGGLCPPSPWCHVSDDCSSQVSVGFFVRGMCVCTKTQRTAACIPNAHQEWREEKKRKRNRSAAADSPRRRSDQAGHLFTVSPYRNPLASLGCSVGYGWMSRRPSKLEERDMGTGRKGTGKKATHANGATACLIKVAAQISLSVVPVIRFVSC